MKNTGWSNKYPSQNLIEAPFGNQRVPIAIYSWTEEGTIWSRNTYVRLSHGEEQLCHQWSQGGGDGEAEYSLFCEKDFEKDALFMMVGATTYPASLKLL